MKIGIIGAGKVGFSLGKYLQINQIDNVELVGYTSKNLSSAQMAAEFTQTKVYTNVEHILKDSDTLFLTVPDGEISQIWDYMRNLDIKNKNICHCSGSRSSTAFFDAQNRGAYVYSIHPLCAINDKYTAYTKLKNTIFTIEGSKEHLTDLMAIFKACGNKIIPIMTEKKALYHASAVMVSNLVIALLAESIDMLVKCGIEKNMAKDILMPLLQGNVQNLVECSLENALTGPIERNDIDTVKKHLASFTKENLLDEKNIYALLSQRLISIAQDKHAKIDYTKMKEVLQSEEHNSNISSTKRQ